MVIQPAEVQAARQDAPPPAGCNVEALHPSQTPCRYRVMTKMSTRGLKTILICQGDEEKLG
jgi:hypothetical protein